MARCISLRHWCFAHPAYPASLGAFPVGGDLITSSRRNAEGVSRGKAHQWMLRCFDWIAPDASLAVNARNKIPVSVVPLAHSAARLPASDGYVAYTHGLAFALQRAVTDPRAARPPGAIRQPRAGTRAGTGESQASRIAAPAKPSIEAVSQ